MSLEGQQVVVSPRAAQTQSEVVHGLHCCEIKLLITLALAAKRCEVPYFKALKRVKTVLFMSLVQGVI